MNSALRPIGVLAVLAAALASAPGPSARRADAQSYVTVIDSDRRPVVGLSEEDFAMRDGGVREHVLAVEPAIEPLAIVVVADGFDRTEQDAVSAAVAAMTRKLTAVDARHQVVTQIRAGGPQALVEALVMACQSLRSSPTDRRAVLLIVRRHPGDGAVAQPGTLTDAMLLGKIALWTIEAGPEQKTPLDKLLADSTDLSGALREIVPAAAGISEAATRVADLLASQYVVTYQWPNPMLSQFNLTIRHDRGNVLAAIWRR